MAPVVALLSEAHDCPSALHHMFCNTERCWTLAWQCEKNNEAANKLHADKLTVMIKAGCKAHSDRLGQKVWDSLGCAGSGVPYSSSRGLRAAGGDGGAAPVLPLDTAHTTAHILARNVVCTYRLPQCICLVIVSMFGSHTTSCWLGSC